jgi:hypothetical protein
MSTDFIKEFGKKTFTIQGRIFHPNLLATAKKQKPEDREVYNVMFAWDQASANGANAKVLAEINSYLQQGVAQAHSGINPAALINPIKKFETYVRQDGKANAPYLKGLAWVNASSGKDFPPQVVKSTPMGLVQVTQADAAEVYSGRNAAVNISFYIIIPKPGATNQKRGFGVNVNAVLLQDGGDKEGGTGAHVDINSVFGSFQSDMGIAQAPQQNTQQWPPQTNNNAPSNNGGGFV